MTSGTRLGDLGFELKYAVDARQAAAIRTWLTMVCRRDPIHPTGFVNSIYFDTPTLRHVDEKVNSDYLKTKVRLRWYDVTGLPSPTAFLEAKYRIGRRRDKVREPAQIDVQTLSRLSLDDPRLTDLPAILRRRGVPIPGLLRPVLVVRYRRDRFVVPTLDTRVSLDTNITVPQVSHRLIAAADPRPLRTAVVEVKGPQPDLPPVLHPLIDFGGRKAAFSKYLACYDHAVRPHG